MHGHWLTLDLYDKLAPFSQRYRLHGWLCEVCRGQEACEPAARRLAEWALLNVTVQPAPDAAPNSGLVWLPIDRLRERCRSNRASPRRSCGRLGDGESVREMPDGDP